jgi:membrane peptidoglycan carboxypeptidase
MTRRRPRSPRRGFATALIVLFGAFGLLIGGSLFGTAGGMLAAYAYFERDLPDPHILENVPLAESSYLYDRTGATLLARFECENRESVTFDEVPQVIIDATVSSEDRTFWTNPGIDVGGIARAAYVNLQEGQIVQGASTITQQVIKYAGVTDEDLEPANGEGCQQPTPDFLAGRSYQDKIREQIMAWKVTNAYPGRAGKERILETYLNLIYYGNQSYGIRAAAANYFGLTDLSQMTIAQAAFLAALPQAPSFLDPFQNPNGYADAIRERDLVLGSMLRDGYITQREYDEAVATTGEAMSFSRLQSVLKEPHFSYRARQEAIEILRGLGVESPESAIDIGGYRITTTLDYQLQQLAKTDVQKWVTNPELADKNVNNGALVSIDSATGEVVAYVGSVDYYNRDDPRVRGEFDVAGLGRRQPGSAFKPIVYSAAFRDRRATVSTLLVDAWTEFASLGGQTSYRPSNADVSERGPVLAMDALRYSLNIPSVKMQYLEGIPEAAAFAQSLGITEDLLGPDPGLTLTLGSVPVSLLEMTQAYSVFAQQGTLHPARTILEIRDRDNRVIYNLEDNGPEETQPMTPAEAYLTNWILEGNTDPAKNLLWGPRAQLTDPSGARRPAGFKTGTTNDFRDVSGFGYVPRGLVTGVWMGNNNQESMSNVLGQGLFSADGPLYLWQDFMQEALNQPWDWSGQKPTPVTNFDQPDGISNVAVCRFTGMVPNPGCVGGRTITVPFLSDALPAPDSISSRGCIDLAAYEQQSGHPQTWVDAARTWSDRAVNGDWGARGNPDDPLAQPSEVRFKIVPMFGESGVPPVCGVRRAPPPPPAPTPGPSRPPRASQPPEPVATSHAGPPSTPEP